MDIDKAWHGIHWLLTGSGGPTTAAESDVIFGGEPFGEDLGFGPARLLSIEGADRVAKVLGSVDTESLRVRMDPAAMQRAKIYPRIWDEDDVLDEYLLPALQHLLSFYDAAAKAGVATPPADRPRHPQNSGNSCLALVAHLVVDLVMIDSIGPLPSR